MYKIIGHFGDKFSIYLLVIIIGSLMLYYAFDYIPQNQLRLDNYGTRILENKARAIVDKYKGYDNAVSSAPISYLSKWFFACYPAEDALYIKDQTRKFGRVYYSKTKSAFFDTLITRQDLLSRARIDGNLIPWTGRPANKDGRIRKDESGRSYFIYTPLFSYEIAKDVKANHPLLLINISEFTSNLKENDFFEDIFLIRAHKCQGCNNSLEEELSGYGNFVLDKSQLGLVQFNLDDSAKNASSGIYQETIIGKQYKVYYKMIKLRSGLDLYVVGLKPLESFKAEAKKVSVWFLVFCSLGALLLIFLFPVLKLFLLSQNERLSTNDISLGVFSVMLCTCLCFILSVGFYIFWGLEMDRSDDDIKSLAKEIQVQSKKELEGVRNALNDNCLFNGDSVNSAHVKTSFNSFAFNEVFLLESEEGFMKSLYINPKRDVKMPDVNLFPVTVAEREYFKAIQKNSNLDYFLQAINSFATGKSEVAMSVPIDQGTFKKVGVITAPLNALLQAGVPSPYQFVVLDNLGDVKFHSGWKQIRSENFLSELETFTVMDAYLKNAITDYIDFTYLRQECRGYIVPVAKDWSVLVYYEKSKIYNLCAQVFILSLISLFITVLFCMVIHLLLRADQHKLVLLKTRPFLYEWVNPNNASEKTWWRLFVLNLALLATEGIGLLLFDAFIASLLFGLLVITISYFVNYFVLRPKPSSMALKVLALLTGILIILLLIVDPLMSFLICLPLIALLWIVKNFKINHAINIRVVPNIEEREKVFHSYRCFMISWLMIIIIGPSIGFLLRHYEHEKLFTTYSSLIVDAQKLREKANLDTTNLQDPLFYRALSRDRVISRGVKTRRCNIYDSMYYNQFSKFGSLNQVNASLQFSYVPSMNDLTVLRYNDFVEVSAHASILGSSAPEIKRYSRLQKAELNFGGPLCVSLLLISALAVLLWRVLTKLSRKVFYLPKHAAWNALPPPAERWGRINFEFANIDNDLHLLYNTSSKVGKSLKNISLITIRGWNHERLILALQKEQEPLYSKAWNECFDNEKFFLFDLSEDGVVNRPDDELLQGLTEKKLIRLYPRLEIINASFANFVRSQMKKEDIKKMEDLERKEGRWKHVRILLIIIIFSAFAFLSIAEESFFGRATALIGSVTLVIPNILNFFGAITRSLTKTSAPMTT